MQVNEVEEKVIRYTKKGRGHQNLHSDSLSIEVTPFGKAEAYFLTVTPERIHVSFYFFNFTFFIF